MDPLLAVAGLVVGFVVGLTGMGGGALMTPLLVLAFGVQPLAAVSSDLVASLVMKPVGGAVHARRGSVNGRLVLWLCVGSVPSGFAGVWLIDLLGDGNAVQERLKVVMGVALLLAATGMVAKAVLTLRKRARDAAAGLPEPSGSTVEHITVRPLPTLLVGMLGGLAVGMTSVGSGSLIIVLLLLLYPTLRAQHLVGTDLVQAVPLVAAASIGHLLFGDFQLDLTVGLLVGALPGVYLGARVSSSAPGGLVRRALVAVLTASALKLVGVPTVVIGVVLLAAAVLGPVLWAITYNTAGFQRRLHRVDGAGPVRLVVRAATGVRHGDRESESGVGEPAGNRSG
ncbi:MAG: sulfite exporter TauE/SafE family protein [Actinomycetes bacterium]